MRALVLAAGLGTRLRPLTEHLPKPLLPIPRRGGVGTVAGATLESLAPHCEAAALNLHHLGEKIAAHFGAEQHGLPLVYRYEPQLLGTLGPLHALRDFLASGGEDFLLVNGDSLCAWPIEELIVRHRESGAEATLLTLAAEPDAKLGGGLGIGEDGSIVQLRQMTPQGAVEKRRDFAGCHIISSRLLRDVAEGPGDIIEGLYAKVLARGGKMAILELQHSWHDLGTPDRYLAAIGENGISSLAEIGEGVEIRNSIVDREAKIAEGAILDNCVLCAGAQVGENARLRRVILGPGAQVPPGAILADTIVMAS